MMILNHKHITTTATRRILTTNTNLFALFLSFATLVDRTSSLAMVREPQKNSLLRNQFVVSQTNDDDPLKALLEYDQRHVHRLAVSSVNNNERTPTELDSIKQSL
jgi:hypothetical protein